MKSFLGLVMVLLALPLYAEDWKTTDGKVYQDVKVIKVEDDAVTVIFKDGGALIPLIKLTPDLQKKFAYDPVKAKVAADARAKADAENQKKLDAEKVLADKLKLQQAIADDKAQAKAEAATQGTTTPGTP
jgi:hypothetical protein